MIYFLAWIAVGLCSFFICKIKRNSQLPKYHYALSYLQFLHERGDNDYLDVEAIPALNLILECIIAFTFMVLGMFSLYPAYRCTFSDIKFEKTLKQCNDYSKRHGLTF